MSSEKPRILHLAHAYLNRGGTEKHVRSLALGLANSFDSYVVAPEGGRIHVIQNDKTLGSVPCKQVPWPTCPYSSPTHERALKEVIGKFNPNLVHIHHLFNWPLATLKILVDSKIPLLMTLHDYFLLTPIFTMPPSQFGSDTLSKEYSSHFFGQDISQYLKERRDLLLELTKGIQQFITPSNYAKASLSETFRGNYRVVEHGISPFKVENRLDSPLLRFGFVGTLLPQKGWKIAVEAFRKLDQELVPSELHLFGGGENPEGNLPRNVFHHGAYDEVDLPKILSKLDIGIVPSLFPETFSYVLSELWMAGVFPIASKIGALGERIRNGENGMLFTPGSDSELAVAMKSLSDNREWKKLPLPKPRLINDMLDEYRGIYSDTIRL